MYAAAAAAVWAAQAARAALLFIIEFVIQALALSVRMANECTSSTHANYSRVKRGKPAVESKPKGRENTESSLLLPRLLQRLLLPLTMCSSSVRAGRHLLADTRQLVNEKEQEQEQSRKMHDLSQGAPSVLVVCAGCVCL